MTIHIKSTEFFGRGETKIGVVAHLTRKPDGFELVDDVILCHVTGDVAAATDMVMKLRTAYVGEHYSKMLAAPFEV